MGVQALVDQRLGVPAGARLQLVQELLAGGGDAAAHATRALAWLGAQFGVRAAIVALAEREGHAAAPVASLGVRLSDVRRLRLDDPADNPVALAVAEGRPRLVRRADAPRGSGLETVARRALGDVLVVPLGIADPDRTLGILLLGPARRPIPSAFGWFGEMLSHCIARLGPPAAIEQERQVRRERTLLHLVLNAVTDPILLTDTEGRLLLANTRAELLFSASETVSEGRRRAIELNNMFFSAALSRTALEQEGELSRREVALVDPADGSDLLFELLSAVVADPREGTGVVSVLRNISDLRRATLESEETYLRLRQAEAHWRAERDRLNLIIDSVADPIIVTDDAGNISLMNARAERLFTMQAGFSESAQRIVQANDASFTLFVSGLLSSGADMTRRGEIMLGDPETGRPVPVEAIAGKMLTALGELTAIVTILHDRTEAVERARLYEQLKAASDELEHKVREATAELARQNELLRRQALELVNASAAKSQFLANVSHELRTPLNAILGYAAITLEGVAGPISDGLRRNLSRIESNGRHLLALIDEVLDISRIEAGQMPMQVTAFDLGPLVHEVLLELEPLVQRARLETAFDVDPGLPTLRTDRQKMKQILVNLISNAVKFTPQGRLVVRAAADGPAHVVLAVTDTGIGIDEEDQVAIFEDFRQVDATPRRAYGGTGLGLAICRRFAALLGGTISVSSELGKGSTFTVRVPMEIGS
jgi:PAS domain S-box-containing protein